MDSLGYATVRILVDQELPVRVKQSVKKLSAAQKTDEFSDIGKNPTSDDRGEEQDLLGGVVWLLGVGRVVGESDVSGDSRNGRIKWPPIAI